MAASTSVGASGWGGSRRRPARSKRGSGRGLSRGPRGGGAGVLKRLKLAVEEFVQATSEGESPGGREGLRAEGRLRPGGRKSRRELRKEKRHLRKARRLQRTTGSARGPGPGGGDGARGASDPRADGVQEEGVQPSSRRAPRPPERLPPAQAEGLPPPRAEAAPAHAQARGPRGRTRPSAAAAAAARKRALLAANEEEDREIRKLERCLGLNKRKRKDDASSVPPSFARDGLDYILGVLGSGDSSGLYESSSEQEEDATQTLPESDLESDTEDGWGEEEGGEEKDEPQVDAGARSEEEEEEEEEVQEEKRETQEAEERAREKREGKRVRFAEDAERSKNSSEVVGAAPQQSLCENGDRYIPPHVRRAEETVDAQKREERERLKKHVQGLINRLSEPNMASISGQLEELYMAHSRKDMNDTLTGVLMSACAPATPVPSRLVMEHMLLVSILHRTVGIEVGAHFLEAVVRRFDDVYQKGSEGKENDNLLAIIAHLYNFHVVRSLLVFDVLKKLTGTFTEKDIELILLMLKNVGFSLRKDDALSLKELISETQAKASGAHGKFQDQTRVRFMLEIMLALKNNDMRKIPGYDPEPVEKLRKLQRALVRGAGSGPETQLRVSWDSILNAKHTGRWWIVGSAWSGAPMIDGTQQKVPQKQLAGTVSAKVLELARKQRMNTDVRRNIFCTIMTSEDFLDAFEKLLKLGLKDQQEREIVHVLMDCCLQEKTYNPFYAFLASKFCAYERRFQMTFQFSIWDKFRDLENLPATNFSNLVHLVGHLLKTKSLPLSILKVVEFSELDKPRVHFLRKVLYMLLMETEVEDLGLIFARVSDNPKLGVLREGLTLFIRHFLLKSTQAPGSAEEASVLRARADLTTKALQGRTSLRM
ncbi:nucleolar MIF4G domain-containing protein 1 isoform X1 [Rhinolophus ferrumequinum]|uniref:nucleolar MIF4G domain-containing protein 1 isoform X1 n=1 Tax=Rhinolophus ferrumequinum TaxID=59479 RepID=UPI00140F6066|nr:nucleolar MIF4G domain-containing protein 1 isoform X1 [Rhinolophus ferrumequinum]